MDALREFWDLIQTAELRVPDREFFQNLWPTILGIMRDPASNKPAAIVLAAMALVVLLMIVTGVIAFLMRIREDEEVQVLVQDGTTRVLTAEEIERGIAEGTIAASAVATPVAAPVRKKVKDPLRFHKRFLWAAFVVIFLIVATGVTTQNRTVCTSCHNDTEHVKPSNSDPHGSISCVSCHEAGNPVAAVTISAVPRVLHITSAMFSDHPAGSYGATSSRSCRRCHASVLTGITENPDRALRMSHKEPVEAGAACLDCHQLDANQHVTGVIQGMDDCLRCHDGEQASAGCPTCHTGDVSRAAVARRSPENPEPKQLIMNPDCYSCHDPAPCDSCHGVRLPHPPEYVTSHMRDAAVDLWDNDGKTCFRCHTAERRSCYQSQCHEFEMPLHSEDGSWREQHQREPEDSCEGCHNKMNWFPNTCAMCHSAGQGQ